MKLHCLKKCANFDQLWFRQAETNFYNFWPTAPEHFWKWYAHHSTFLVLSLLLTNWSMEKVVNACEWGKDITSNVC